MKNIRKRQIKDLFNNFINTLYYGIWFSGIKKEGLYKDWYKNGQLWTLSNYENNRLIGKYQKWDDNGELIFEIEFKNNRLIGINYINFKYDESWFNYYDRIQNKLIYFYHKIKEMYNDKKYKKSSN